MKDWGIIIEDEQIHRQERILTMDVLLLTCVLISAAVTVAVRSLKAKGIPIDPWNPNRVPPVPPRLIVGTGIIWVFFLAFLVSLVGFLYSIYDNYWPPRGFFQPFIALMVSLATVILVSQVLRNILHVAMDVINHFHRRQLSFPVPWGSPPTNPPERLFQRRERVQARFRSVLEHVLRTEGPTHLTVVAHSQGTVIAADVLREFGPGHGSVWPRSISLLTMGSPLAHLYQHYFPNFYPPLTDPFWDPLRGLDWINLFRIDDYVGTFIEPRGSGQPDNRALAAGGHANYWRQRRVLEILSQMIPQRSRATDAVS